MAKIDVVRRRLLKLHKKLKNWRNVGVELDLPSRTVWRVAMRNYEPKREDIRLKLGLGRHKGRTRRSARTLWDWPAEELRKALEHREDYHGK